MVIRNACYPDACSKTLIQKPEDRFEVEKEEIQPEQPVKQKEEPSALNEQKSDTEPRKEVEKPIQQQKKKLDTGKPSDTVDKKGDISERMKNSKPLETIPQKVNQPKSNSEEGDRTQSEAFVRPTIDESSRPFTSTSDPTSDITSECKNEKADPLITSAGVKERTLLVPEKSSKLPDTIDKPEGQDDLKMLAGISSPKEKVPTSSHLETNQTRNNESGQNDKEPTNSSFPQVNNDGAKKYKPSEGPTSMQTLGVPKIAEPQSQEKSHSIEVVGKQEKPLSNLSPDAAKPLSNQKKSLKPVQVG